MDKSFAIMLTVFSTLVNTFGSYYLKKGADKFNFSIRDQLTNYHLSFGILFFAVSTVFYLVALSNYNLSVIYPISSLSYVWVTMVSSRYLNEEISKYRCAGLTLIVVGVFLVTR